MKTDHIEQKVASISTGSVIRIISQLCVTNLPYYPKDDNRVQQRKKDELVRQSKEALRKEMRLMRRNPTNGLSNCYNKR